MGDLHGYVQGGGSVTDLRKRIADHGLVVASAIGFAEWIVDDDQRRAAGLETAKKDMSLIAAIGGTHIAAPPAGATKETNLNLHSAAERYRALLDLGDSLGVIPQIEVWGFSTTLSKLGETALVALESQHAKACMLLDIYHLHKGGSGFTCLPLLAGSALHCFHMNDYPADPPRQSIKDADRVYPGDGIAPLTQTLQGLFATGFRGTLSLELFNPEYWKQDAMLVARTGLEKMKESVAKAAA
jgi:sugar phosphate isomerase/epimerase